MEVLGPKSNPESKPNLDEDHSSVKKLAAASGALLLAAGALVGPGGETVRPGPTEKESSQEIEIETTKYTTRIDSDVLNDWQRLFETDSEDTIESSRQIQDFIDQHYEIFAHPERLTRVSVFGLASAEDDNPSGGLIEPNDKNVNLALQRGEIAKAALAKEIKSRFGYDLAEKITVKPIEDQLSEDEMIRVDELAKKYQFDTVEMIKLYNRGRLNANQEITDTLDELLLYRRGALIEIESTYTETDRTPGYHTDETPSEDEEPTPPVRKEDKAYIPLEPEEPTFSRPNKKDIYESSPYTGVASNEPPERIKQPRPENYTPNTTRRNDKKQKQLTRKRGHRG